jgi:hypothetical protein
MFDCCGLWLWEAGSNIPGDLFFLGGRGAELGEEQMNEHSLKLSKDGHIKIEWFSVLPVPTLLISARLHVVFQNYVPSSEKYTHKLILSTGASW